MADQETTQTPSEPTPPDPLAILRQVLAEALAPLAQKVDALAEDQKKIRQEMEDNQQLSMAGNLVETGRDIQPSRANMARSVTIQTRVVRENPEQYPRVVSGDAVQIKSNKNPLKGA